MTHKARKHTFGLMDLVDSGLDDPSGAAHDIYCPLLSDKLVDLNESY